MFRWLLGVFGKNAAPIVRGTRPRLIHRHGDQEVDIMALVEEANDERGYFKEESLVELAGMIHETMNHGRQHQVIAKFGGELMSKDDAKRMGLPEYPRMSWDVYGMFTAKGRTDPWDALEFICDRVTFWTFTEANSLDGAAIEEDSRHLFGLQRFEADAHDDRGPCMQAEKLHGTRFQVWNLPRRIPLPGCEVTRCRCSLVHEPRPKRRRR